MVTQRPGHRRKRWIDTLKDCLKNGGLDVRQARKIVHDRSEWRVLVMGGGGYAWGRSSGMNP